MRARCTHTAGVCDRLVCDRESGYPRSTLGYWLDVEGVNGSTAARVLACDHRNPPLSRADIEREFGGDTGAAVQRARDALRGFLEGTPVRG